MLDTVALVGDEAKVYGDVAAQTVERSPLILSSWIAEQARLGLSAAV